MFLTYTRHLPPILHLEMPEREDSLTRRIFPWLRWAAVTEHFVSNIHTFSRLWIPNFARPLKNASPKWSFRAELLNLLKAESNLYKYFRRELRDCGRRREVRSIRRCISHFLHLRKLRVIIYVFITRNILHIDSRSRCFHYSGMYSTTLPRPHLPIGTSRRSWVRWGWDIGESWLSWCQRSLSITHSCRKKSLSNYLSTWRGKSCEKMNATWARRNSPVTVYVSCVTLRKKEEGNEVMARKVECVRGWITSEI